MFIIWPWDPLYKGSIMGVTKIIRNLILITKVLEYCWWVRSRTLDLCLKPVCEQVKTGSNWGFKCEISRARGCWVRASLNGNPDCINHARVASTYLINTLVSQRQHQTNTSACIKARFVAFLLIVWLYVWLKLFLGLICYCYGIYLIGKLIK